MISRFKNSSINIFIESENTPYYARLLLAHKNYLALFSARDEIIRTNYKQYSLVDKYVDVMAADITNFPMRTCEFFDAVITDRKLAQVNPKSGYSLPIRIIRMNFKRFCFE